MHRLLLTSFAILTLAGSAAAQQHDPIAAESLFRDAREAFKKGDYQAACPKFAESNRLDPATGTLFNLADCEERAGKTASAWQHWRDVIDALRSNTGDERYGIANQHATALEPRLPRLRIKWARSAFPNATVKRDGVELGAMSMDAALPTDPGAHTIEVTASGRKPAIFNVQAVEAKTTDVEVSVGDEIPVAVKPDNNNTTDPGNQQHVTDPNAHTDSNNNNYVVPDRGSGGSSGLVILGVVSMVLGGGALITGIATGGVALADKSTIDSECSSVGKLCSMAGLNATKDAPTMALVSDITLIAGSVLIVGGLVLAIAGSGGKSTKAAHVPLWLQGRF